MSTAYYNSANRCNFDHFQGAKFRVDLILDGVNVIIYLHLHSQFVRDESDTKRSAELKTDDVSLSNVRHPRTITIAAIAFPIKATCTSHLIITVTTAATGYSCRRKK